MKTIVMWFRNDLRVLDNPALFTAVKDSDQIIPLFIIDENLTSGEYSSSNRNKFLLESLLDLDKSLRDLGAKLVIKSGKVGDVFEKINQQVKIDAVYCSEDYSPYSIKRDKELGQILEKDSIEFKSFPGRLLAEDLKSIVTGSNSTYKVFTPFYNNWINVKRRQVFLIPTHIKFPEI